MKCWSSVPNLVSHILAKFHYIITWSRRYFGHVLKPPSAFLCKKQTSNIHNFWFRTATTLKLCKKMSRDHTFQMTSNNDVMQKITSWDHLVLKIHVIENVIEKCWPSNSGWNILSNSKKLTFLTHSKHKFSVSFEKN